MIEREEHDDVTVVRLDHGRVNALDLELVTAIAETFEALHAEATPLVFTASGAVFSAGVDLRRMVAGGSDYARAYLPALSRAFLAVFDHPGPTVAALNGHALAGGYVLAAACDRRFLALGPATVGLTELAVGVPFPAAALEIVRHALGGPTTAELVLSAARFDVREAAEFGLVHDVVPPQRLLPAALDEARRLGSVPARTYQLTKQHLQRAARDLLASRAERDDPAVTERWADPQALERMGGFLAGLDPR